MDFGAIIALIVGFGTILLGNTIEGGRVLQLMQPAAFFIVIGGTIGATMLGSSLPDFRNAILAIRSVFRRSPHDPKKDIESLIEYAQLARRDGIIALENAAMGVKDTFMNKALMLAVDGADTKRMRDNLELLLNNEEEARAKSARVWEQAGGYSPTIGIIGAVLGLIQVMQHLADVAEVGRGISVAFVATIYGVGFANLFCLPIAARLRANTKAELHRLEMILEGALAIQEGQNPSIIRERLESFVTNPQTRDEPPRNSLLPPAPERA